MERRDDHIDAALLRMMLSMQSSGLGPWRPVPPPAWLCDYLDQLEEAGQLQGVLIQTVGRLHQLGSED